MKKNIGWIAAILALVMVLSVGMGVFAEEADTEIASEVPVAQTETSTELQDALEAYSTAKRASRVTDLEEELTAMVEAGQLTQEQADTILAYANECASLQNGTCPNCAYQFQTGAGRRGSASGKGMMGGKGGRGMGYGFRAN